MSPTNESIAIGPTIYVFNPQEVELKYHTQDEVDSCNIPGKEEEIQLIKRQGSFWIRGKEEQEPGAKLYGLDYFVSRCKDCPEGDKVRLIRTMKGYNGGVCRLHFDPIDPRRALLHPHCETIFAFNLLAACFKYNHRIRNPKGSWDPTNPEEVPTIIPNRNRPWRNENVAKLAKEVCQPLIRLHWTKAPSTEPQEMRLIDIWLALIAARAGNLVNSADWMPTYDLVLAESADGPTDMLIMRISEFSKLFSNNVPTRVSPFPIKNLLVPTITARINAINAMFTDLFKEPYWPDLFFCECPSGNCGQLELEGDNFIRQRILNMIAEFEAAG